MIVFYLFILTCFPSNGIHVFFLNNFGLQKLFRILFQKTECIGSDNQLFIGCCDNDFYF